MEQEYKEIDLWELLAPIRAHWIKILFVAAVGGLLSMLFSIYLITPKYQASAMLIVNTREDQTSVGITNEQITSAKNLVATYAVILKSNSVMDEVIDRLELNTRPETLAARITAQAVDNTQVMQLTISDEDPALAQRILQEVLNLAPEKLTSTVKAGSVEIIEPAHAGVKPVSPSIPKNTLLGFGAALVLALAVVYIRKFLRNTFLTGEDITNELGLTVLGVIPKIRIEG